MCNKMQIVVHYRLLAAEALLNQFLEFAGCLLLRFDVQGKRFPQIRDVFCRLQFGYAGR